MRRAALGVVLMAAACEPREGPPPRARPCPPAAEPARVATVVGTIGKLHLVESRYPLTRIGDVIAAHKPDLVLLAVGVEAYRENHLDLASFEMTYARFVAKEHGAAIEPIEGPNEPAALPPVEPWDAVEIARRETEVLVSPPLFTFDQANGADIAGRVLLAQASEARYRGGAGVSSRRRAWMTTLIASAVERHDHPKRVLAVVDVLDRPHVDGVLHALGYASRSPVDVVNGTKEVMAGDIPPEVIADWQAARTRAAGERAKVLDVAIEKRGACCVPRSALQP